MARIIRPRLHIEWSRGPGASVRGTRDYDVIVLDGGGPAKWTALVPVVSARCTSSYSSPKVCETSDKKHIVCFHPTNPFAYENTKPIPRPDPSIPGDLVNGILEVKFKSEKWKEERDGPGPEELGKMFYTTKHRWYPIGIRRRMTRRIQPPRDRPYL